MNIDSFTDTLDLWLRDRLRAVRTIMPCKVVSVNHFTNSLTCKPLTKTRYRNGSQVPTDLLFDVPYFIYSASRGSARITMPIAVNDNVLVLCSDRDYGNLLQSDGLNEQDGDNFQTLGLYPILAIPCFYTTDSATPADDSSIVIENGTTKITIGESGNIDLETEADITAKSVGLTVECETASVNATTSVTVESPTVEVTADTGVNITTPLASFSGVVSASAFRVGPAVSPSVEITGSVFEINGITLEVTGADVIANGISLSTHIHPAGTPPGNTGTPV